MQLITELIETQTNQLCLFVAWSKFFQYHKNNKSLFTFQSSHQQREFCFDYEKISFRDRDSKILCVLLQSVIHVQIAVVVRSLKLQACI